MCVLHKIQNRMICNKTEHVMHDLHTTSLTRHSQGIHTQSPISATAARSTEHSACAAHSCSARDPPAHSAPRGVTGVSALPPRRSSSQWSRRPGARVQLCLEDTGVTASHPRLCRSAQAAVGVGAWQAGPTRPSAARGISLPRRSHTAAGLSEVRLWGSQGALGQDPPGPHLGRGHCTPQPPTDPDGLGTAGEEGGVLHFRVGFGGNRVVFQNCDSTKCGMRKICLPDNREPVVKNNQDLAWKQKWPRLTRLSLSPERLLRQHSSAPGTGLGPESLYPSPRRSASLQESASPAQARTSWFCPCPHLGPFEAPGAPPRFFPEGSGRPPGQRSLRPRPLLHGCSAHTPAGGSGRTHAAPGSPSAGGGLRGHAAGLGGPARVSVPTVSGCASRPLEPPPEPRVQERPGLRRHTRVTVAGRQRVSQ